uniref:NADH-ubiquinone oxidoreductase chain 2 n=1 Tax=Trypaea australiensis TaxID=1593259 RepID=A0A0B4ZYZ8_9EUCA|nr:NADH dehydrogenase subunit 2 [Trypaea australiensis]AJD80498.2 NADH dehydrogenase subunit 2 [Trypaea australiensis]
MLIYSSKLFFFCSLSSGVLLSISSDSWFGAWCGLELNLMSFIPFISLMKNNYTSEASLKYFLIQALGSAVIILGAVSILILPLMKWVVASSLMLKMGAAPLHFWFPSVMSGLNWLSCLVLMSIQKIAPLSLLSYMLSSLESSYLIIIGIIAGATVGSIGGLNQVFLRKILAYSSINHMSWMLSCLWMSDSSWIMYFAFYVLISSTIVYLFYSQNMNHISHMAVFKWSSLSVVTWMSLLSLGGLPPFTGFVPKWFVLQEMMFLKMFIPSFFLLAGTLVSLYYYLRLIFLSMSVSVVTTKWSKEAFFLSKKMSFYVALSLMGLIMPSFFFLFFM